ncbi:Lipid A export ATP-binding/permease protein MsbA [Methylophaga frappieri]|uniref:Lipid A export ATP-binding/permease protein MsbA n=1 Tax=Methylophaga frappieri (strain ATCC BAA-2434 / DSM 25690 / JAM7) TaxID=754477 RepID=I1YHP7_METFJ|nr:lipid A export permease/ATP-binding protein MsbA [Methylophaga frappieri]AFJ02440.1 Lipid A export ATP-binding/permease protein MsbA [Methylophaga frappieri]
MKKQSQEVSAFQLYKRLLCYAKPYWRFFIVVVLAMVVYAATEAGIAMIMKPLMDEGFVARDAEVIRLIPVAIVGLFIIRGLADFFTTYGLGWIARNVIKTLREESFEKLLVLPARFYDHGNSGQLMSKLLYDVEQVSSAATDAVLTIIRDSLTIIVLLVWMIYLSGFLALLIMFTVPFIALLVYYVSIRFRHISKQIQNSMGSVSHVSGEIIEGHREIKTFGGQEYEARRFEKVNERNRQQQMKKIATDAISQPLTALIAAIGIAIVVYIATLPRMLEQITVGDFISFITAMMMLLTPMKRLTKVNAKLQAGIAAAESIFGLLDESPEADNGQIALDRARGEVSYEQVSFRYDSDSPAVLNQVSFQVKPGQTIAFVGHSGSGKTSLVSLLPRFYNATSGRILVDDIDIQTLRLRDLRRQISFVNQQVILFNDTVANNISYGQPNVTEADIIDAAKAAHAWDFIQRLPDGLHTDVGENGVLLSGGQRQRLAIARALLRDAPILILDEATASLDTEAERHIQAALEGLMQTRTTLVIAHRLSTIEKADLILVMHNGDIVESGTHQALLERGQHYAELYRLQFQQG